MSFRILKDATLALFGHLDARNAQSFQLPSAVIDTSHAKAAAGFKVTQMQHLHKERSNCGQAIGGTVAAYEEVVFVASGDGTIRHFKAILNTAITNAGTASFDLKKNGTTILSGTVDFSSSDADGDVKAGTLSSTTLVADDELSIEVTVASAPDGLGPLAWVEVDEAAN